MHRSRRTGFSAAIRFAAPCLLLAFLAGAPATADDVHLLNGNSFEGVVAVVDGDVVRIRLPHGELALPMARVERIDRRSAPLEEYLERKRSLTARTDGGDAAGWLELAGWAARHGLEHSTRESAVAAAERNPRLAGLDDLLTPLGYVYDGDLNRWLSRDENLRRRGWVFQAGRWWSPEEQEAQRQARRAALDRLRERQREQLAEKALEQAIRARVEAEIAREVAAAPPVSPYGPYAPVHGGYDVYGGSVRPGTGYVGYGVPVTGVVVYGYPPGRRHGQYRGGPYRPSPPRAEPRAGATHRGSFTSPEGSLGSGPVPGKLRNTTVSRRP